MKVLFIGDIFASPGLNVTKQFLQEYKENYDFIIANGENASGGFGLSRKHFKQILSFGADVVTLGNHSWDQRETLELVEESSKLIRPLNYPLGSPGRGYGSFLTRTGEYIAVIQAQGRIFMEPLDCPYTAIDNALESVPDNQAIIVDFHAEASSEKKVMGYHLKSRVTAVLGTHTHVQTADEMIMGSTAYITDVGMTGPHDSVIGVHTRPALQRFLDGMPSRFETATGNPRINAVVVTADPSTGKASAIERVSLSMQDVDPPVTNPAST